MKSAQIDKVFSGDYVVLLQEDSKTKATVPCYSKEEAEKIAESWKQGTYQLLAE